VTGEWLRGHSRLARIPGFGVSLAIGLAIAAILYLLLAIGECLPRDGSAEMHACEAIRRRDVRLYPVLLGTSVMGSVWLHWRGAVGTWLVALTSGLIAAVMLMTINALSS
jgi:hypothetical protein